MSSADGVTTQRIATFVRWSRDRKIVVGGTVTLVLLAVVAAVLSGRIATPASGAPAVTTITAPAPAPAPRRETIVPTAAPYAIPAEVKDEVSASAPRRAVERPAAVEAAEARPVAEARPERNAAGSRKSAPPVRAKHAPAKTETTRAPQNRSSGAASVEASAPAAPAEPSRRSVAAPEMKKRAQLVDDQARVKLLE